MSNIKNWSKTPLENSDDPPNGAPEGWAPGNENLVVRQQMADHRTQWEDAQWFNWGHTPVRVSNTTFLISGTATEIYSPGRRLRIYDTSTLFAEVIASSLNGANTLVSFSGSAISSSISAVDVAILDAWNPIPTASKAEQKSASISSTNLTTKPVTLGVFKNHPAVPRALCSKVGYGTGFLGATHGYYLATPAWNIRSVTATVTAGPVTVTFEKSLTSTAYTVILSGGVGNLVFTLSHPVIGTRNKGGFTFHFRSAASSFTATSHGAFAVAVYGSDYEE